MNPSFPVFHLSDVVMALFAVACVFLYIFLRKKLLQRVVPKLKIVPLPLPDIDTPDFESTLASALRDRIAASYAPAHTRAHTAREISRYASMHPYAAIIAELEEREYQSHPLSTDEKREVLTRISKWGKN